MSTYGLRTAPALQDPEGPGGGEEPDTDLGKRKKMETADALRKYVESRRSRAFREPIAFQLMLTIMEGGLRFRQITAIACVVELCQAGAAEAL